MRTGPILLTGTLAVLLIAASLPAASISLEGSGDTATESELGIHVYPSGPENLPSIEGNLEVLGGTDAFLQNSPTSRYSSGEITFDQPAAQVTLNVARANDSGYQNAFTLLAYDNGQRVAEERVVLSPTGEWTQVTVSAAHIDQVSWQGENWILQPEYVRSMDVTFAVTSAQGGPATVGQGVPEPGSMGLGICAAAGVGLRRRSGSLGRGRSI